MWRDKNSLKGTHCCSSLLNSNILLNSSEWLDLLKPQRSNLLTNYFVWIMLRVTLSHNHLVPLSGWRVDHQQSATWHKSTKINSNISHFSLSRKNKRFSWYSVQVKSFVLFCESVLLRISLLNRHTDVCINPQTPNFTGNCFGRAQGQGLCKNCHFIVMHSNVTSYLASQLLCVFHNNRVSTGKDPVWDLKEWVNTVGFRRVR